MPLNYTHYRMGCDVLSKLPAEDIGRLERSLFDIGLCGPDILFCYCPFIPNHVSLTGYAMHRRSPAAFLRTAAARIYSEADITRRNAMLSYISGFICHYSLDKFCHSYIHYAEKHSSLRHRQLEAQLERFYLEADGLNCASFPVSHIIPSPANCRIISELYMNITPSEIYTSLRGLRLYSRMICFCSGFERELYLLANRCPRSKGHHVQRLDKLYRLAVNDAAERIHSFILCSDERGCRPCGYRENFHGK